ncbi:hypothetical protein [Streptomyces sp. NPDC002463]|uniref:hypothetical protein n=1 Tax=Streptomyces sp. NPDC002463 TaxID=3364645 RepID=UPI0036C437A4
MTGNRKPFPHTGCLTHPALNTGRATAVSRGAFKRGLLVETWGSADEEVIKLVLPPTVTDEDLTEGLEILQEAMRVAPSGSLW